MISFNVIFFPKTLICFEKFLKTKNISESMNWIINIVWRLKEIFYIEWMFDVKRSQYFTLIILFQNNLFQEQFCTAWRVEYYQYESVYFRVVCVSTYVIAHKQYTVLVIVDWMYGVGCDVIIYGCCHNSDIFCHWKIINFVFYCTTLNAHQIVLSQGIVDIKLYY